MNQPPIPPIPESQSKQCPNCGQSVATNAQRCAHCGAPLPTQGSVFLITMRVMGAIILGIIALVLGACGACFMLVSAGGGISPDLWSGGLSALNAKLTGVVLLIVAAICIWGAIIIGRINKKR